MVPLPHGVVESEVSRSGLSPSCESDKPTLPVSLCLTVHDTKGSPLHGPTKSVVPSYVNQTTESTPKGSPSYGLTQYTVPPSVYRPEDLFRTEEVTRPVGQGTVPSHSTPEFTVLVSTGGLGSKTQGPQPRDFGDPTSFTSLRICRTRVPNPSSLRTDRLPHDDTHSYYVPTTSEFLLFYVTDDGGPCLV